jgi:hypothetical protein
MASPLVDYCQERFIRNSEFVNLGFCVPRLPGRISRCIEECLVWPAAVLEAIAARPRLTALQVRATYQAFFAACAHAFVNQLFAGNASDAEYFPLPDAMTRWDWFSIVRYSLGFAQWKCVVLLGKRWKLTFCSCHTTNVIYVACILNRMTTDKPIINFVIDPKLLDRIDDFRFKNRFASRAAAIMWLLKYALDAKPKVTE